MTILEKQIERSNTVFVFPETVTALPEPSTIFGLYTPEQLKQSNFADDSVMRVRVFDFPAMKMKLIAEPQRIRVEDEGFRKPAESPVAREAYRIIKAVYPNDKPAAYGFNYDAIYRMTAMIPQSDILKSFIKPEFQEYVNDFGCQFTFKKEKGKKLETYFIKAVSPLEFRVHVNHHFVHPVLPTVEQFQAEYERWYDETDAIFSQMSF